jgi:hypothetical protein
MFVDDLQFSNQKTIRDARPGTRGAAAEAPDLLRTATWRKQLVAVAVAVAAVVVVVAAVVVVVAGVVVVVSTGGGGVGVFGEHWTWHLGFESGII